MTSTIQTHTCTDRGVTLSRPGSDATNAPSDVTAYMSQIRGHPPPPHHYHPHRRHLHDHPHHHDHHRHHHHSQTLTNHCCNQKFYFLNLGCIGLEIKPHLQYDPNIFCWNSEHLLLQEQLWSTISKHPLSLSLKDLSI